MTAYPGAGAVSAEERAAVEELVARYNWAIDTGDGRGVAACFVEQGVFSGISGRYEGHAELAEFGARFAAAGREVAPLMHWVTNLVLARSPRGLRMRAYVMVVNAPEGAPRIHLWGHYDDQLVQVGGAWRFASRRFRPGTPERL
ncbi:nuclear transport factor 2 family protein [Streptomyces sp. NPDC057580]|uniref:nuclear transport factor 2 family protein n=1 Tax=Streptomyces sp. NPDC057580 TaxID=3346173 RepID=UPI00367694E9